MLTNVTPFPSPDTGEAGEISEPTLQEKLDSLQRKSGMSSYERDFVAKLRSGHTPTDGEQRVLNCIWIRHRGSGRPNRRLGVVNAQK